MPNAPRQDELRDIKYLRSNRVSGELLKRMETSTVEKDITTAQDALWPASSAHSPRGLEDAKPIQIRMQAMCAHGIRQPAAVEGRHLTIRAFVKKRAQHPARESAR